MKPSRARIKDIAHLAGVSIGTVDRVLHNRGEVSEKTRQKISRILKETNYSPNIVAKALKSKKSYHLVFLLPEGDENSSYWQKHPLGMEKAVSELELFPVSLTTVNFNLQSEKDFQDKTQIILELNPDGVVLAPIFKSESIDFCRILNKRKIPFVFIDGYIEKTGFLAYIGEDVYQSGKVAGQLTDMVTEDRKDILVVNIARNLTNVHHLKTRTDGFMNYFDGPGRNRGRKISINIPEPDIKVIRVEMDKVLDKYPGIGSIFISGSKSYLIAGYLREKGLKHINLIGYDLLDTNVSCLKEGIIRFLIGQRPEQQTYLAVKKLFEYLSANKLPEKYEYLPVDIVTSENVDYFLKS